MPPLLPRLLTTSLAVALAVSMTACATDWTSPRPATTAVGSPADDFMPASAPSPEATVDPAPGSWAGVHPAPGYRVVLLTGARDGDTSTALADAVVEWAADEKVDLRTVQATGDPVVGIVHAMDLRPELIISVGDGLIDALAMVTPSHLDMHFLILGAELAEPTANVTAVDWTGAGYRGEGLGSATHFDTASFTPARCGDAVRAGTTAVLTGSTGIVLWIE